MVTQYDMSQLKTKKLLQGKFLSPDDNSFQIDSDDIDENVSLSKYSKYFKRKARDSDPRAFLVNKNPNKSNLADFIQKQAFFRPADFNLIKKLLEKSWKRKVSLTEMKNRLSDYQNICKLSKKFNLENLKDLCTTLSNKILLALDKFNFRIIQKYLYQLRFIHTNLASVYKSFDKNFVNEKEKEILYVNAREKIMVFFEEKVQIDETVLCPTNKTFVLSSLKNILKRAVLKLRRLVEEIEMDTTEEKVSGMLEEEGKRLNRIQRLQKLILDLLSTLESKKDLRRELKRVILQNAEFWLSSNNIVVLNKLYYFDLANLSRIRLNPVLVMKTEGGKLENTEREFRSRSRSRKSRRVKVDDNSLDYRNKKVKFTKIDPKSDDSFLDPL